MKSSHTERCVSTSRNKVWFNWKLPRERCFTKLATHRMHCGLLCHVLCASGCLNTDWKQASITLHPFITLPFIVTGNQFVALEKRQGLGRNVRVAWWERNSRKVPLRSSHWLCVSLNRRASAGVCLCSEHPCRLYTCLECHENKRSVFMWSSQADRFREVRGPKLPGHQLVVVIPSTSTSLCLIKYHVMKTCLLHSDCRYSDL
jgi:hypothetical protein